MSRGSCWAWPERATTQAKTGCSAPRFAWGLQAAKTHNVTASEGPQRKGQKNQVEIGQREPAEKPSSGWSPHELGLCQKKRPPRCGGLDVLAEKEGFEPSIQEILYAGFRIRCIRPLCHLSKVDLYSSSKPSAFGPSVGAYLAMGSSVDQQRQGGLYAVCLALQCQLVSQRRQC